MKAVIVAATIAGCSFEHGRPPSALPDDAPPDDAPADDSMPPQIDAPPMVIIDAPPPPADARICPTVSGCTSFQCAGLSSCYYLCGTTNQTHASWPEARDACAGNPNLGCIVTLNNQAEHTCVTQHTNPSFQNGTVVWIGYVQSSTGSEPDGGWRWQCGNSSYVASNWGSFEPNDAGGEDCAALTDGGGWFDADCQDSFRYVCELP